MRFPIACVAFAVTLSVAVAGEPQRFVERTPPVKHPPQHTHQRAGTDGVSRFAVLTPTPGTGTGYVNGTFGTDHVGHPRRYFRLFRSPSADPARGTPVADLYSTRAAHVPDVFALRPFRNAVIGAKEAGHEHR